MGVELVEDRDLHIKCSGCMKADWALFECEVISTPKTVWQKGSCWARDEDPKWEEKLERHQAQFQQARRPGIDEDLIGWLMATKPPSIRDKEPILHLPAPPAGRGSKSGKRKKRRQKSLFKNPYIQY